jgi:hypothetical protein
MTARKGVAYFMQTLNLAPSWFFGYVVLFEALFAIVALVISLFARKVYNETDERQALLLHLSFMLISFSYFVQTILNLMIYYRLTESMPQMSVLYSVIVIGTIGIYSRIFLMMAGLLLLLFMTLKSRSSRTLWIIFTTSMLAIVLSANIVLSYYVLSSAILLFISWHFISNYFSNKQAKTLLIAFAFMLLFFGNFHFLLSVKQSSLSIIGHLLELAAYALILANLYLVLKK